MCMQEIIVIFRSGHVDGYQTTVIVGGTELQAAGGGGLVDF